MNDETTGRDPYSRDPYSDAYGAHDPYAPPTAPAQPTSSGSDAPPSAADTRAYPTSDPYAGQSAYTPPSASYPTDPYAAYRAQGYADPYANDPYAAYAATATSAPPVTQPAAPRAEKSGRGGMIALASAGLALTALVAGTIGGAVGFTVARMTQPEPVAAVSIAPIGATGDAISPPAG